MFFTADQHKNGVQFRAECQAAIDEARPQLERHRGWKQALRYLALLISDLGLPLVLVDIGHKHLTGKHCSFFQTDSAKKLDELGSDLDEIVTDAAGIGAAN